MKLQFDDKYNFIEIKDLNDKIAIILSSKDSKNHLRAVINSIEISKKEFVDLISDIDLSSNDVNNS